MKPLFEQDRVLVRLQQRVQGDRHIAACFLAGSFGRRAEDAYSDMDVALVFADELKLERAWSERREFVRSVVPFVGVKSFDAVHVRPYFHIALYSNGAKVDYRYETKEALQPSYWDRDIRILKDDGGWLEAFRVQAMQAPLVQSRLTADELTALDERFWVMFMDVYRLLRRGDADKPFTIYLELLHFTLPPLLRALPPEEPSRQQLLHAAFSSDTRQTIRQLVSLLDAYLAARTAVIRRFDLDFEVDGRFETAVKQLLHHS
ncbi:MAG: hypothetical protein H6667_20570 [Ardenticatenaceae bacterium]|nr:hypothetical protein [Ardenticatenaceae bacterium]MCB9445722.1 hypothetical protein [Ardenticatenaceae bacterium]